MSYHYIPQEIINDILLNLRVKSLCRFLIVSKSWNSLITTPSFISTHLHNALINSANGQAKEKVTILLRSDILSNERSNHFTFLEYRDDKVNIDCLRIPRYELNLPDGCIRIVGSSNGLLCLATELCNGDDRVTLWNPSIRRSVILPLGTINPTFPYILVYGFGTKLRDEDCKVVKLVYQRLSQSTGYSWPGPPEVEVYSLKTRTWKRVVSSNVRCRIMPNSKSQVLINGCSHWLAYRRRERALKNLILAFDMNNETFSEILVPDDLGRGNRVKFCYNLFEELLTIVKYTPQEEIMSCCIWIMKEYGVVESWTRIFSFDLVEGMERVIGVLGDGEFFVTKRQNKLVSYNIKTRIIKDIGVSGPTSLFYVDRYSESLVLLGE